MNSNYNSLLNLISSASSEKNKKLIETNMAKISGGFANLSSHISEYVIISSTDDMSSESKIAQIRDLGYLDNKLSKKEATEIYKTINFQNIKGGSVQEKNLVKLKSEFSNPSDFCMQKLPTLLLQFFFTPRYLFLAISSLFGWLAELSDFNVNFGSANGDSWVDFSGEIDWIYLLLFMTASIPGIGSTADIIIIIKAILDGRYFLAIITTITYLISFMLTMHLVDLGMIFKIFYYLDAKSYKNEYKILANNPENLEYTNKLDQTVTFGSNAVDDQKTKPKN